MTEANPLGNEIANLFTGVGVQGTVQMERRDLVTWAYTLLQYSQMTLVDPWE